MFVTARRRPPRRIVAKTLALGGAALLSAGMLASTPDPASGWNQGSAEATVWQLLNGARVNNGVAPLQQHATLVSLARWRSQDMLERDYFSHTILGTGCEVYCYYDSSGLSYVWGGENIGWNSGLTDDYSPVRVHEAFMESTGHRSNALNGAFTHGGVGAAAAENIQFQGHQHSPRMYTELFMQATGASNPAPAPAPAPPPPPAAGSGSPAHPAPAVQAAAPRPREVTMDAPARPVSAAGLDGRATPVIRGMSRQEAAARLAADDALGVGAVGSADVGTAAAWDDDATRVRAAQTPESGLLDALWGAIIGFIFG